MEERAKTSVCFLLSYVRLRCANYYLLSTSRITFTVSSLVSFIRFSTSPSCVAGKRSSTTSGRMAVVAAVDEDDIIPNLGRFEESKTPDTNKDFHFQVPFFCSPLHSLSAPVCQFGFLRLEGIGTATGWLHASLYSFLSTGHPDAAKEDSFLILFQKKISIFIFTSSCIEFKSSHQSSVFQKSFKEKLRTYTYWISYRYSRLVCALE